jgi:hypothetical protein
VGANDSAAALALDNTNHAFAICQCVASHSLRRACAPAVGRNLAGFVTPSAQQRAVLLGSPAGATIAWVHFLAFDLFVGRWIYLESHERQVNPWLMAPVLFLTLMLGPAGFLLYLMVRSVTVTPAKTKEPLQSAA